MIEKFLQDPEWAKIEEMVQGYCDEQLDMTTVDTSQPAEHVKAEIIGRVIAYNSMQKFLSDSKIISNPNKGITSFK